MSTTESEIETEIEDCEEQSKPPKPPKPPSQSEKEIEFFKWLLRSVELAKSDTGDSIVRVTTNVTADNKQFTVTRWFLLHSQEFECFITAFAQVKGFGLLREGQLNNLIKNLHAVAQTGSLICETYLRVASFEDRIYVHLTPNRVAVITADGVECRCLEPNDPPLIWSQGMLPMVEPNLNATAEDFRRLDKYLNLTPGSMTLFEAALLTAYFDDSQVIVEVNDATGKGKTYVLKVARAIIDPHASPYGGLPSDDNAASILAADAFVSMIDNEGSIPPWFNKWACRVTSGSAYSKKLNFENDRLFHRHIRRQLWCTTTEGMSTSPDFISRSFRLKMDKSFAKYDTQRKRAKHLDFTDDLPYIVGALFKALSHGLRTLPSMGNIALPRNAGAYFWCRCCEGFMWKPGQFHAAHDVSTQDGINELLKNPIVTSVIALMEVQHDNGKQSWEGYGAELFTDATNAFSQKVTELPHDYPRTSNWYCRALRKVSEGLKDQRINIAFKEDRLGTYYHISEST
jgi:hypothetical protein